MMPARLYRRTAVTLVTLVLLLATAGSGGTARGASDRTNRGTELAPDAAALTMPGDIVVASTSDTEVKGTGHSRFPAISADGTKVAFQSRAANLDPADTDTFSDIYVKDLTTGDTTLASTSDTEVKGTGGSFGPAITPDGTKVAFSSTSADLDPADTDTIFDIYVKDLSTGDITLASTSDTGVKSNGQSELPSISADGTKVAFQTGARNFDPADTDFKLDVYVKDLATGNLTLASTSDAGVKGDESSELPAISADGTKVAFQSFAHNLDSAYSDLGVFVKDLATGDIILANTSDGGVPGCCVSGSPAISADGTRVAFYSESANLDPADTDTNFDIFIKDLTTGDITLVSTSDTGANGNGSSGAAGLLLDPPPALSADATKVAFFSFATNLDPADTDATLDIYVKDLTTGDITLASTSDTGVKGNGGSFGPAISVDGTRLAFDSRATNLDQADTDTILDVYVKELGEAELSVRKSDSPDPAFVGEDLTYSVTVANGGPDAASGALIADDLPPSVTFVSATASQGSCTESEGRVTCTLGSVGSGATATVDIVVRPTSAGRITNTVAVTASAVDPIPGNNSDSEDTRVCRRASARPSSIPCR
jgi:uncharacterized repeat protein (TIGR01451 family)